MPPDSQWVLFRSNSSQFPGSNGIGLFAFWILVTIITDLPRFSISTAGNGICGLFLHFLTHYRIQKERFKYKITDSVEINVPGAKFETIPSENPDRLPTVCVLLAQSLWILGQGLDDRGSITSRGRGYFSSPLSPHRLCGSPSLLSNAHRGSYTTGT